MNTEQWEYIVTLLKGDMTAQQQQLDRMGKDGWELVYYDRETIEMTAMAVMKRQRPPADDGREG